MTVTDAAPAVDPHLVEAVRAFTRFYTAVLGVLDEGLLHTPFSVTEARIVYELAQRERTDVAELRRELRVDAGYMSRITARLEAGGLVTRERSDLDARRVALRLTDRGREVFADLDARSAEQVEHMLRDLPVPV
ncbi:MAG TPA: MarR family transcriptional regulator, partial [Pedococcus sp.]|nr:MarR family transcriptional regulator [Pedococcus sp.]